MIIGGNERIQMRETSYNRFRNSSSYLSFTFCSIKQIEIYEVSPKKEKQKKADKKKVLFEFYNDRIVHEIVLKKK